MGESQSNRRDRCRKNCQPRPIDLCSLGKNVVFYAMTVVDESKGGLGCVLDPNITEPQPGTKLDWCGLKRYEVCWTAHEKDGKTRLGLRGA